MRIVFRLPSQEQIVATVAEGESLMRAAVENDVPGIYGDCGGQCACATCHVYIDSDWIERVGTAEPGSTEESMLEGAPADVQPNSRLACQVILTPDLDGLVMLVPQGQ